MARDGSHRPHLPSLQSAAMAGENNVLFLRAAENTCWLVFKVIIWISNSKIYNSSQIAYPLFDYYLTVVWLYLIFTFMMFHPLLEPQSKQWFDSWLDPLFQIGLWISYMDQIIEFLQFQDLFDSYLLISPLISPLEKSINWENLDFSSDSAQVLAFSSQRHTMQS